MMFKLSTLLAIASSVIAAEADGSPFKPPSVEDAAIYARTLVKRESLTNVNTISHSGSSEGKPVSFVEYYADCGDGNPVLLAIDMSTSYKNYASGSPATLSIRVGDHPLNEHVNPKYPGSRPNSVAGSPRINLRGSFVNVTTEELPQLEACFLERHRDARWWLPGNPIHSSHFVKFEVDGVYFLGGFGDTGYIGEIPSDLYLNATTLRDQPPHGEPPHGKPPHEESPKEDEFKKHSELVLNKIQGFINELTQLKDSKAENNELKPRVISLENEDKHITDILRRHAAEEENIDLSTLSLEQINSISEQMVELKKNVVNFVETHMERERRDERMKDNSRVKFMIEAGIADDVHHRRVADYHRRVADHHRRVVDHHGGPRRAGLISRVKGFFGLDKPEFDITQYDEDERSPRFHRRPHGSRRPHRPEGGEFERPHKPEGGEFERPHRPEGGEFERPHRPEGGEFERPHRPEGGEFERPHRPEGGETTHRLNKGIPHAKPGVYSSEEVFRAHHPNMEVPEAAKNGFSIVLNQNDHE